MDTGPGLSDVRLTSASEAKARAAGLPPVVCTLNDAELAGQALEWSDLSALSLTSRRIDGGVAATYPVEYLDQITDLAERENSCCGSWLNLELTTTADEVQLAVTTANPDGLKVIMSMTGFDNE